MAVWDLILKDAKGNDTVEERKVLVEEPSSMNRTAGGVIATQLGDCRRHLQQSCYKSNKYKWWAFER